MPHITIHYLERKLRSEALKELPNAIAVVIAQHLDVSPTVVTVSLCSETGAQWDSVLERAGTEGSFLRLPTYPTNARLT